MSPDRIVSLEDKISRLIDAITHREARAPYAPPPGEASSSFLAHREDLESGGESFSNDVSILEEPVSDEVTGVYELPNSVLSDRGVDTTISDSYRTISLSFAVSVSKHSCEESPPATSNLVEVQTASIVSVPSALDESTLARELFGSDAVDSDARPWNDLVIQKWRDLARKGLDVTQKDALLKKYSVFEDINFLKAPRLNQECKSAFKNNSIAKRDEYNLKNHDQLGIALVAFGEAISDLLKPEVQLSLLSETRSAIAKIHDGIKIIGDLYFRLSLSRRAQIKPAMNPLARSTADAIPADDLLFGASFGEELKKATLMEKSSKDIVNASLSISKKVQQPIKFAQQPLSQRSGNARAPAARPNLRATRSTGASRNSRRSPRRHRSRLRRH